MLSIILDARGYFWVEAKPCMKSEKIIWKQEHVNFLFFILQHKQKHLMGPPTSVCLVFRNIFPTMTLEHTTATMWTKNDFSTNSFNNYLISHYWNDYVGPHDCNNNQKKYSLFKTLFFFRIFRKGNGETPFSYIVLTGWSPCYGPPQPIHCFFILLIFEAGV